MGKKMSLHFHIEGDKSVDLKRTVFVVIEGCCPGGDTLLYIIAAGKDGWSIGSWRPIGDGWSSGRWQDDDDINGMQWCLLFGAALFNDYKTVLLVSNIQNLQSLFPN